MENTHNGNKHSELHDSMINNRIFINRIEESVGYKGKFLTAISHQHLHYQATTNNKTASSVFVLFRLSWVYKEY